MIIQISSGDGPAECQLAVEKLVKSLQGEFPGLTLEGSSLGAANIGLKSAILSSGDDLSFLEGTVAWICTSPIRPGHKRKNWFIDVSVIQECGDSAKLLNEDVRFQTFRSGGPGGQNVNKIETGVRATHLPTGLTAMASDERSQHMNKRTALERLRAKLLGQNQEKSMKIKAENRLEHSRLIRGNPVRVYRGPNFIRDI